MTRSLPLFLGAVMVTVAGGMNEPTLAQEKKDGPKAPYTHVLTLQQLDKAGKVVAEIEGVEGRITKTGKWAVAKTRVRPERGDRLVDADKKAYTIKGVDGGTLGQYLVTTDPAPKAPQPE